MSVYGVNIAENVGFAAKSVAAQCVDNSQTIHDKQPKYTYFHSTIRGQVNGVNRVINVTDDYIFKGIFRDEARLKNFLESVLVGHGKMLEEGTIIEKVEYLPTEYIQNKIPEGAKKSVFDLQVKTNHGLFIVEMQKNASSEYLKRAEFYSSITYSQQQIKGEVSSMKDYTKALPVIVVSVMEENLFEDDVPCVSYHINTEQKTSRRYMNALSYVFIELQKFGDDKYDQAGISKEEADWFKLFKTQEMTGIYTNAQVQSAIEYITYIRDNRYDEYIRHQITLLAAEKEHEDKLKKAVAKGKAEGINIGKAEGKAEGIDIGKAARNIEIAKNLLSQNIDINTISVATGLSLEQIEKIKG